MAFAAVKAFKMDRRQFLASTGGVALGMTFGPSLLFAANCTEISLAVDDAGTSSLKMQYWIDGLHFDAPQARPAAGSVLEREHRLKQRMMAAHPLRLQFLDQFLERQILVLVGCQRRFARAA